MKRRTSSRRPSPFLAGMTRASPVFLAYLPIGVAYGVVARDAGLHPILTVGMSALVVGGLSQIVAVQLLAAGASLWTIVSAAFFINLRHSAMAASMAPYLSGTSVPALGLLAWPITDEPYAVAISEFRERGGDARFLAGVELATVASWVTASAAGYLLGAVLKGTLRETALFALPILLLTLLMMQITTRLDVVVVMLAAGLSIASGKVGGWFVLACIAAAAMGSVIRWWKPERWSS